LINISVIEWWLVLLVEKTRVPGGQFYWLPKPEYLEKTPDLPQVTGKLYQ
jgi:hypothetical protein